MAGYLGVEQSDSESRVFSFTVTIRRDGTHNDADRFYIDASSAGGGFVRYGPVPDWATAKTIADELGKTWNRTVRRSVYSRTRFSVLD